MASITIRRLDDAVKTKLRLRAARHGRSMEEEAREILKSGLSAERRPRLNFAESIRRHIDPPDKDGRMAIRRHPAGPGCWGVRARRETGLRSGSAAGNPRRPNARPSLSQPPRPLRHA